MPDWPILCSSGEVKAMLEGRISQTVRIPGKTWETVEKAYNESLDDSSMEGHIYLWVREAGYRVRGKTIFIYETQTASDRLEGRREIGMASDVLCENFGHEFALTDLPDMEPPLKCPRWASRFTLFLRELDRIKLHDLDDDDFTSQGLISGDDGRVGSNQHILAHAWEANHDREGQRWEDNPEVIRMSFEIMHRNIGPKDG